MLRVTRADDWLTRLAKLIPAEALAFYGTVSGMIPAAEPGRRTYLLVLAVLTAIFTAFLRLRATGPGKPQVGAVAIAVASFLFWAAALPGDASPFPIPADKHWLAGVAAFVWVTVVTTFYKGDAPP